MAAPKRTIEVDSATAAALESRAAEAGLSVSDLLAEMVARHGEPAEDIAALDRQWAAIKAGEPTVPHADVVRWLDTWGTRDPFATFTEWADQADEKSYSSL